jgi:hypothetical protein
MFIVDHLSRFAPNRDLSPAAAQKVKRTDRRLEPRAERERVGGHELSKVREALDGAAAELIRRFASRRGNLDNCLINAMI